MALSPAILFGHVMHKRLFPRVNAFTYGIYYLAFPLKQMAAMALPWRFGVDSAGPLSFYARDHGARDDTPLEDWARGTLKEFGCDDVVADISLVTLPRVLGYVFNPVSFWLCHDAQGLLRAVLCEVNNTFGETHTYLCAHDDLRVITAEDTLEARKVFHVSPFLKREGHYTFRFADRPQGLGVWIDFYDADGRKQLLTALTGQYAPFNKSSVARAFFTYPLVTLTSIARIHWHALKLLWKKMRYIPKPQQLPNLKTRTGNLTKL